MNCEALFDLLGYHCAPLTGGGFVVTTPHKMPSGVSIPVFVEPSPIDGHHRLWDAGELLFEIISSGVKLRDRRSLKRLIRNVERRGATLTETGELELLAPARGLAEAYARFVGAALEMARWNEEALSHSPDSDLLIDEIAELLRRQRPGVVVEREVEVQGFSRRSYSFDFRQGDRLVDSISASPQASAFEIRKLTDVRARAANADTEILVVVDDRRDSNRAAHEIEIISQLAHAQSLTALRMSVGNRGAVH